LFREKVLDLEREKDKLRLDDEKSREDKIREEEILRLEVLKSKEEEKKEKIKRQNKEWIRKYQ